MKFGYGVSDFSALMLEDYYYQDRTAHIPLLENAGKQLIFIRPRRLRRCAGAAAGSQRRFRRRGRRGRLSRHHGGF